MKNFMGWVSTIVLVVCAALAYGIYTHKIHLKGNLLGVPHNQVLLVKIALVLVLLFLMNRMGAFLKFITGIGMLAALGYLLYHIEWIVT